MSHFLEGPVINIIIKQMYACLFEKPFQFREIIWYYNQFEGHI